MNNSTDKKNNSTTSWVVVGLLLYFFFPVGIYFLLRKLRKEPKNYKTNANVTMIIGGIFGFMGVYYALAAVTGNLVAESVDDMVFGAVVMLLICGGIGAALIYQGMKYKKLSALLDRYYPRIINSEDGSLDKIAAAAGLPADVVYGDLLRLIGAGALGDSYIDEATGKLESALVGSARRNAPPAPENKTVTCPYCGGTTGFIPGAVNKCEYCDSLLK